MCIDLAFSHIYMYSTRSKIKWSLRNLQELRETHYYIARKARSLARHYKFLTIIYYRRKTREQLPCYTSMKTSNNIEFHHVFTKYGCHFLPVKVNVKPNIHAISPEFKWPQKYRYFSSRIAIRILRRIITIYRYISLSSHP
jgi:hypothetical protein